MKLAQSVKIGAWLLIAMNLLMAFGSIWIFMRMAPAIEVIIAQNEVSLEASEEMLAAMLMIGISDSSADKNFEFFRTALNRAKNNVTEKEEPAVIDAIIQHYKDAFDGNELALKHTVSAIVKLGDINREAMRRADSRAQQLGYAGAWGVVFMATITFMIGMIFLRSMRKNLTEPMQEIDTVVSAFRRGDKMRRCSMGYPSKSVKQIFNNINELLDMHCATHTTHKADE
jgi:hypothetical protein